MIIRGESQAGILQFQERRQAVHGGSPLVLYAANLDAHVFVYLYLRSATCSLVWRGPQGGQFDPTLPFEFLDTQFHRLPTSKLDIYKRSVQRFGSSMLHKPYKLKKCLVTLFIAGEERLREYDLIAGADKYEAEILQGKDALANVSFVRVDSNVEYNNQDVSYSLTFERLGDSASEDWEFTLSIPRDLELYEGTLKWIAKHHRVREVLRMDFKASLDELSKKIKPQSDPIYV